MVDKFVGGWLGVVVLTVLCFVFPPLIIVVLLCYFFGDDDDDD
ncbi:hypothetical protein HpCK69_12810 [Helicobacter pylori]